MNKCLTWSLGSTQASVGYQFSFWTIKMFLQDPLTGAIENIMRTPYKKAHRVGGPLEVRMRVERESSTSYTSCLYHLSYLHNNVRDMDWSYLCAVRWPPAMNSKTLSWWPLLHWNLTCKKMYWTYIWREQFVFQLCLHQVRTVRGSQEANDEAGLPSRQGTHW